MNFHLRTHTHTFFTVWIVVFSETIDSHIKIVWIFNVFFSFMRYVFASRVIKYKYFIYYETSSFITFTLRRDDFCQLKIKAITNFRMCMKIDVRKFSCICLWMYVKVTHERRLELDFCNDIDDGNSNDNGNGKRFFFLGTVTYEHLT